MRGPVGVPERERGVIGATRYGCDLVIGAAVLAVHVRDVGRLDEEVVHGCVEIFLLRLCAFDDCAAEERIP